MEQHEGKPVDMGGVRIWCQSWRPEAPKAVVVISHGIGEHSGRYGNVVDALVPRGYALHALDHRGHGRSGGQRGHIDHFTDFTADLGRFVDLVKAEEAGLPLFLFGHSLGGAIALAYALERPQGLQGVVASAPWLRLKMEVAPTKLFLGRVMDRLWPTFSQHSGLPADDLSHDPEVARRYREDPLVHDLVSARLYMQGTRMGQEIAARAAELRLPLLLIQAADDPLINSEVTRRFFAAVGSPDKTLREYEGFYHECHNEVERQRPLGDLAAWLETRL